MSILTQSRKIAYEVLSESRKRDAYVRNLLDSVNERNDISAQDKSFLTFIVLGVTATSGYLDQLIDKYLDKGVYLKPDFRIGLKISIFEMLYMATPVEVAVSQGVDLCSYIDSYKTGVANGVLRTIADVEVKLMHDIKDCIEDNTASFNDYVAWCGMPSWLLKKIKKSLSASYKEVALSQLTSAPVFVGVDPNVNDVVSTLTQYGFNPKKTSLPFSYELKNPKNMNRCDLFDKGDAIVSDLAAQLISLLVVLNRPAKILEIGQGRATKTMMLEAWSSYLGEVSEIVGVDCVPFKKEVALSRTSKKWPHTTTSVTFDATKLDSDSLPEELEGLFDVVFCDVPCTGTGTMRRHPEIAWSVEPSSLNFDDKDSLVRLQADILQAAASKVKPGGLLVYSTCSILRDENINQIKRFLGNNSNFKVTPITDLISSNNDLDIQLDEMKESIHFVSNCLQTVPCPGSFDGHFAAFLKKSDD